MESYPAGKSCCKYYYYCRCFSVKVFGGKRTVVQVQMWRWEKYLPLPGPLPPFWILPLLLLWKGKKGKIGDRGSWRGRVWRLRIRTWRVKALCWNASRKITLGHSIIILLIPSLSFFLKWTNPKTIKSMEVLLSSQKTRTSDEGQSLYPFDCIY